MFKELKKTWRQLKAQRPGTRFQKLYRLRQQSRRHRLNKTVYWIGGLLLIGAGVISYPVPVIPSEVLIVFGLALLAQASMFGARTFDWLELRLRSVLRPAIRLWKPLPAAAKWALGLLWTVLLSLASFGVYRAIAGL